MSDETIEFSIPADADGYVTFQCPYCDNTFKLHAGECQEDDIMEFFCPYCGLVDEPSAFLNDEIMQLVTDKAKNFMIDMLNDFGKELERSFRGNSIVQMKSSKIDKTGEKEVFEVDSEELIVKLDCCDRHLKVKYDVKESGVICPYCGVR
jgi:uncharacterized Zn-finger protein